MTPDAAATSTQQHLADRINTALRDFRPDLSDAVAVPEEMVEHLAPNPAVAAGDAEADRISAAFRAMPDAQLGELVGRSELMMVRYVEDAGSTSGQLLWLAFQAFKAGCIGIFRGGTTASGVIAVEQAQARFEEQLMVAFNGEIVVARTNAQRASKASKRALMRRIRTASAAWAAQVTAERAALDAELELSRQHHAAGLDAERQAFADERAQLQEQHDMALHGLEQAQADATAERRRADALAAQVTALQAQLSQLGTLNAELTAERARTAQLTADLKRARQDASKRLYDRQQQTRQRNATPLPAEKKPAPPEVIHMPESVLSHTAGSTLEALSLSAYARRQGLITVVSGQTVQTTVDLTPVLAAWQRDVPDHRAFLKSLSSVAAVRAARVA